MMDDKTMDPLYLAQTGEPKDIIAPKAWRDTRLAEARERGATFFRFSWQPGENPKILLLEGWAERPEDQGEPRFMISGGSQDASAATPSYSTGGRF